MAKVICLIDGIFNVVLAANAVKENNGVFTHTPKQPKPRVVTLSLQSPTFQYNPHVTYYLIADVTTMLNVFQIIVQNQNWETLNIVCQQCQINNPILFNF